MKLRPFTLAVALATFATLAAELMLTRIFSVTMYYHFAFMVISLALLGLAVAGVALYLLPRVFTPERAPLQAGGFMLATALGLVWALDAALGNPIELKKWGDQLGRLGAVYLATAVPFVTSGFAVTIAISAARSAVGRVYAYDLIGAALGCVAVVPAIALLQAPGAVLLAAAFAAASAVVFAASASEARRGHRVALGVAGGAVALALAVLAIGEPTAHRFGVARNPGKFLGKREVLFEKWNAFSQIVVAPAGDPDHRWIFIDADAATRLWSAGIAALGFEPPRRIPEVRVASAAYAIRHRGPALVIGPGGGTDVISALYHGVRRVVGVEINPIIVDDVVRGAFAGYAGDLYRDPRVEIVVDEGRSYVRRAGERFQTIQATLVDTWAASSSGAFTLSENNIYTVEAFEEFLGHLTSDGVLVVTRWYTPDGPAEFLRLIALARAALEARGVAPADVRRHVMLLGDRERRATLLVSPSPFTAADLATMRTTIAAGELQAFFLPPIDGQGGGADAPAPDEDRFLASFLRAPSADGFLAALPYDARPTRDDKPFFFYSLRPSDLPDVLAPKNLDRLHNLGVVILLFVLGLSLVITFALVILPLVVFRRGALRGDRVQKLRGLGFFVSLGLGFILVEIGLMQSFVLFLGHPIYALVVVLAVLLAAAGVGSALSGRLAARSSPARAIGVSIAVLAGILVVYALGLAPLFRALLGVPLAGRVAIAALLVLIPGVVMGGLLPNGLRIVAATMPELTPWAWAVNGAASVVGSVAAVFVSMNFGFTVALFAGLAAYGLGALAVGALRPTSPP